MAYALLLFIILFLTSLSLYFSQQAEQSSKIGEKTHQIVLECTELKVRIFACSNSYLTQGFSKKTAFLNQQICVGIQQLKKRGLNHPVHFKKMIEGTIALTNKITSEKIREQFSNNIVQWQENMIELLTEIEYSEKALLAKQKKILAKKLYQLYFTCLIGFLILLLILVIILKIPSKAIGEWDIKKSLSAWRKILKNIFGYPIQKINSTEKEKNEKLRLKLLESVVTHTNDAVIITKSFPLDASGPEIIFVNDAFTKITGYTIDEALGKTPRILQGALTNKNELDLLKKALINNESFETTIINYHKNGNPFWLNIFISPVFNNEGICTHFIAIEKDITAWKETEVALKTLLSEKTEVLESIGYAFISVDKNWNITYWNIMAELVLGKSSVSVIGKNLWNIYSIAINSQAYFFYHKAIKEQQPNHFEYYSIENNCWYEISAYPTANGLSIYFKDINERKKSQIELSQLNENLRKYADRLLQSNKELEEFAHVVSHDLQEPLRMVSSFLTLLEKRYQNNLDEKGNEYIQFALGGAKRMRNIIRDLLNYSQFNISEYPIEAVNLKAIIEEVELVLKKQILDSNANIHITQFPTVQFNKFLLATIFEQLIGNGIKFQHKNKQPNIGIDYHETIDFWNFSIKDNGIGIDRIYYKKIFFVFKRLNSLDDYSGNGLGLSLIKKIIDQAGGTIRVDSTPDIGSCFYISLPKKISY
ncbi:MAG: PAS domain-containing protein [Sphingobacteriia bacterium]|nr:MAG: PAS domain-containing protein [Sphingobacteriia bacterium]